MLLKNKTGFSLLEVVISLGVFALISLGSVQLMQNSSRIEQTYLEQQDLFELRNMVDLMVKRDGACGIRALDESDFPEINTNQIKRVPSSLATETPLTPIDLYFVNSSGDISNAKRLIDAKFKTIKIQTAELIFPDIVMGSPLPPGDDMTRAVVVVHAEKKGHNGNFEPMPPLMTEVSLKTSTTAGISLITDCGSNWDGIQSPPLPLPVGVTTTGLNNGSAVVTPLGEHSLCVITDRGIKTTRSKKDPLIGSGNWKDVAQRSDLVCNLTYEGTVNRTWFLSQRGTRDQGKSGEGHYSCKAFCF